MKNLIVFGVLILLLVSIGCSGNKEDSEVQTSANQDKDTGKLITLDRHFVLEEGETASTADNEFVISLGVT